MAQLEGKSYEELASMLTDLEDVVDQLKGNSQNFVKDQIDRHAKYGDRMFISAKQLDWLKNLHEEWCGTAQYTTPKEEREVGDNSDMDDDSVPF